MSGHNGLLGPTARPMVRLGGENSWKTRVIKGIYCSFQWMDLRAYGDRQTPFEGAEPCMVLFRPDTLAQGAYVVPQRNAYLYGHADGTPTQHLLTAGFSCAEQLGFDMRDKQAIRQCIDIIIEGLPDLILMPSDPPNVTELLVKEAVHGIEATARINGKKVYEELL